MTPDNAVLLGDCVEVMAGMEPESVDAIVTDPPYGLEFMGKEWDKFGRHWDGRSPIDDHRPNGGGRTRWLGNGAPTPRYAAGASAQAFHQQWAEAAYRVAKPSAYLLAFGGTRTVHRMTVALEDAGWIIRDMLVWAYASGFPKSKASLKPAWEPIVMARKPGPLRMLAIDSCRIEGQPRTTHADGNRHTGRGMFSEGQGGGLRAAELETPAGRWPANVILGDALFEPGVPGVIVGGSLTGTMTAWSSSPDSEPNPTVSPARRAARRSSRGVPGVSFPGSATEPVGTQLDAWGTSTDTPKPDTGCSDGTTADERSTSGNTERSGRTPTDPSLPASSSTTRTATGSITDSTTSNSSPEASTPEPIRPRHPESSRPDEPREPETSGDWSDASENSRPNWQPAEEPSELGYSRFFLIPKADRADREPVLGGPAMVRSGHFAQPDGKRMGRSAEEGGGVREATPRANHHPTVKPTELMRHLVRLVTPTGGLVLDPFLGSGTTAIACELEGFRWLGIEKEPEYVAIAEARLNGTQRGMGLSA